jgi:hypothetical protein
MRLLLASLVVGWAIVGSLQGCSSSSSPAGAEDAGLRDGTTTETGSGGHDAQVDGFPASDAAADAAADVAAVDVVTPDEAAAFDAKPEGATEAGEDADAGPEGGTVVDCGSTPTLHVDEAGAIYCGFTDAGLGCPTGQECCLGGFLVDSGTFEAQQCAAFGATCTNGVYGSDAAAPPIPIMCGQIADCKANGLIEAVACCLQGATAPAAPPTCTYPKATLGTAVVCESSDAGATGPAACATGEVQICSSQADCPTGTTCTPGKWKILEVGFCL